MSQNMFQCGLIEGFYSELRRQAPKELKDKITQRATKSWPKDAAYNAGHAKGRELAAAGQELPNENRCFSLYLGYRYEGT